MGLVHNPSVSRDKLSVYLDPASLRSYKFRDRLYDYGIWADGQTGSVGIFNQHSVNNERIISTDPWGNNVVVWKGFNTEGSANNGGMLIDPLPVDNTKMYRCSWWEKRLINDGESYSRHYAGCNGYGATDGLYARSNGGLSTNPYFWYSSIVPTESDLPLAEWILIVAHVWPVGSGTGGEHADSGRWRVDGSKLGNITVDFVFHEDTTTFRSRNLVCYRPSAWSDNVGEPYHYTLYPRLDVIDGTEPSLDDLLNNRTDQIYNLMGNKSGSQIFNGPNFTSGNKGELNFDGVNDYIDTGFGDQYDLGTKELTIDIWVKANTAGVTEMFLTAGGTAANSPNRRFYLAKTGGEWRIGIANSSWSVSGATATTNWTNLVFTCNPYTKTVKMYVNGIYSGHSKTHTGYLLYQNISVGSHGFGEAYHWDGKIGPLKIYEKILSDTEIESNFLAMKGRYES